MSKLALFARIWLANRLLDVVRLLVPQAKLEGRGLTVHQDMRD
jgi:hypothetical protein